MSEQKTHAEIIEEMRFHGQQNIDAEKDKPEYGILTMEGRITQNYAAELDAAHKREVGALNRRCAELDAEVAAKDEVIKRLNDAISEEQRRKMAITENSSAVGDAAKLREALKLCMDEMCNRCRDLAKARGNPAPCLNGCEPVRKAKAAVAAPPRNCDVGTAEEQSQRFDAFCDEHKYVGNDGVSWCSRTCPCYNDINCGVNWAQMPYDEEGGAK